MITQTQLSKIYLMGASRIPLFLAAINTAMQEFEINTPIRAQMFIAQVGHESAELRYTREIASGSAYEGRLSLGNTRAGDGVRFKGRGLIQITGRANYAALMIALGIPCVDHPELLESPIDASRSAAWFWKTHGCNELADAGNFLTVTKRINGGTNGLASREIYYDRAKAVIT